MRAFYKLTAFIISAVALCSCEKVIDLDLKDAEPQLVIEGEVRMNTNTPVVKISRSVRFDEPSKFPGVSGATVNITGSNLNIKLTETSPGVYQGILLNGRPLATYNLQVSVEGKTYKASSTMPRPVVIDSVAVDEQSYRAKTTKTIVLYYTDPPDAKNYYRFLMAVNGVQVKEVFARNDDFNDGRQVRVALFQDDIEIKSGDRVDLEMKCIDAPLYTYWFTFSKQSGRGMGNGSVAPSNPPNNFDTPVLGYFSAHTSNRRVVTVQ